MPVLGWLNDQLLRMTWLSTLVARLVENVFGLDTAGRLGGSVHFFIYDVIKIFVLLAALVFGISYVQSFFPPERTKRILGRFSGLPGNIIGALLGTVTPFCSCSSIPLFIGFTNAGLPLGVTISFLISSPLVDLASILLLAGVFNWGIALAYVAAGIILAVVGGTIISRANMEQYVESFVSSGTAMAVSEAQLTVRDRIAFAKGQVTSTLGKVWLYVVAGVGIGAAIHNWIPADLITAVLGQRNSFAVLLATLVGVPMYTDIFGTLPIAEALVAKGVGLGTALALMMAVTALSLPSIVMLKRVMKAKLLVAFVSTVVIGIAIVGYAFNALTHFLV